jgi:hypothetical protein
MAATKRTTAILKKKLLAALEDSLGIVTTACLAVGCNRETYYSYRNSDPEFKEKTEAIGDVALDFVESSLFKQIKAGDGAPTIFYLKTKGRNRGYIERQEIITAESTLADLLK